MFVLLWNGWDNHVGKLRATHFVEMDILQVELVATKKEHPPCCQGGSCNNVDGGCLPEAAIRWSRIFSEDCQGFGEKGHRQLYKKYIIPKTEAD
ncbi:hypothetical protein AXF42_Ash016923 [Apostasia shenzhenica]|uniref:Uncharacterized protein n=1 Tax=Apostasia shenzhenica TaxID=1088818 RepID=A0A2H9ZRI6_9ASPA|nr:hypothetical protein AXF42_Ash016923 [Apostasia shenzhenica]